MGLSRSVVPLNKASLKALDVSVKSLNNGVNRTGNITVYSDTLLMFYSFSNDVEKFLDYTQNAVGECFSQGFKFYHKIFC